MKKIWKNLLALSMLSVSMLSFSMLATGAMAAPIDLSNRDTMVKVIAASIIATQPYCWDRNLTGGDKRDDLVRQYGHTVDDVFKSDVKTQIGKYIDYMGKSVENYNDVCAIGYVTNLRINNRIR